MLKQYLNYLSRLKLNGLLLIMSDYHHTAHRNTLRQLYKNFRLPVKGIQIPCTEYATCTAYPSSGIMKSTSIFLL